MNPLGTAIMVAMRDQGWLIMSSPSNDAIAAISPVTGNVNVVPSVLLNEPDETRLRIVLMALVVAEGLMWPWPPDHDDTIHGEQPIGE